MSDALNDDATEEMTQEVETDEVDEATEPEKGDEVDGDKDDKFDAAKAHEKIRKANSEAKNLRKRAADAEAKAQAAGENGEKVTALEAENLKLRVGITHGLPVDLATRLQGSTEEELLEDAEKLMGLFETRKPPTNQPRQKLKGGGDPTQEPSKVDNSHEFAKSIFDN